MGTIVLGSGTAVFPSKGDVTFLQMKTDVATYYGMEHDPGKVALAGRAIQGIIDELNAKQLWEFNLVTSPDITTVNGTKTYDLPTDFWKIYNSRKTNDIDYQLSVVRQKGFDSLFQSQRLITGLPYTLVIKNTFRGGTVEFFPTPDGVYTVSINYYKLIATPTADTDVLDLPKPYQHVPRYGALARLGLLNDVPALADRWQGLYERAYQDMKSSDADLGDEDLRFINIEELAVRAVTYLNPAVRPRAYDLF